MSATAVAAVATAGALAGVACCAGSATARPAPPADPPTTTTPAQAAPAAPAAPATVGAHGPLVLPEDAPPLLLKHHTGYLLAVLQRGLPTAQQVNPQAVCRCLGVIWVFL